MTTKNLVTNLLLILLVIGILAIMAGGVFLWMQHKQRTTPQPEPEPTPTHTYVDDVMSRMSLEQKVASLFIFHTPGTDAQQLTAYMQQHTPSGLIFMGDNIPTSLSALPALTKATTTDEQLPAFTAIDEEGGVVARLPNDTFASAETLRNEPPEVTKDAFTQRSYLLKSNGFNLNFGIIADVTNDPNSFIYPRVLGTDAQAAAERVKAAVEGSAGITLSTIKHFPGHGETPDDSHATIPTAPTSYQDWQNRVSVPFKAGVEAGADMMMFGHLRYSEIDEAPASLSKKWHDIARNELGFQGIIVTDDMTMLQDSGDEAYADPVENAVTALQAGSDLLLYVLDHESEATKIDPQDLIKGVTTAVENETISEDHLNEIVKKLLITRHNLRAE